MTRRGGRRSRARGPLERRELDAKAAKLAAFDLLARKSWSARELTSRLRRRGAPDEVAREVVAEMVSRGYVDDASFARFWAESRARGRRVGSRRLPALLRSGRERAAPRLRDYLVRRGYPPAEVMRTVAALTATRPDGDAPAD